MGKLMFGHQRNPRLRDSYNFIRIKIRKPYCLDCGGLPMLSTYIRKGAQGKRYYVVAYWCEFCDGLISEWKWSEYQDGTFEGYALWCFSEKQPYFWMKTDGFKQKMKELRLKKLEELEKAREVYLKTDQTIIPLVDYHIQRLKQLLRLSLPKQSKKET